MHLVMQFVDVDEELSNAIKFVTPEFASSLKRRFTNTGVSEEIRIQISPKPLITFEDACFCDRTSQITLKDLILDKSPTPRMNEIIPNLLENNLNISVDWYNVTLKGSYDMTNISQLLPMPVRNSGTITINLETVKAKGLVGFTLSRDALKTTNFDLNFTTEDVDIMIDYFDCEAKINTNSSIIKKNIDYTFVKHLKRDLYWKLQESLRERLDRVLLDFSVLEVFGDNMEISTKYAEREEKLDKLLNQIIDELLIKIKGLIIAHGYSTLSIPDFKKDFSQRFGIVTFWGSFHAKNGTLSDLSQIKRTSDFSFTIDNKTGDLTIFGSLGLEELKLHYSRYSAHIWNIGPWGDLKASVGKNSVCFKVVAQIKDIFKLDVLLKDFHIKIVQFENIKVEATGMTVVLNWLLSNIVTWITGHFKQHIIQEIEKQLSILLKKSNSVQNL